MIDRDNRTFICSVVYFDIANYSTKSVEVQIRLKEQLNRFTTEAIKNVAVNDRIILDTGDGAAICFLGDPEDALFVAMNLRSAVLNAADPLQVRFGINLGPVKVVNDINDRRNIIGDGINVGQRVMSFAEPGQILVSRSYYEVVSCLTQEYARLFHYLGMRADKNIRKHEIYSILPASEQAEAVSSMESALRDDVQIPARNAIAVEKAHVVPPDSAPALEQSSNKIIRNSSSASFEHLHWLQTKKFIYGGVTLAAILTLTLFFVINRNFGGGEIHPDKSALSPEVQLKSPEISQPEKTQSAENINQAQTESTKPAPPVSSITPQQESPGESLQESPQSPENAAPDQTVQTQPAPSVPNAIIQFAISPWGEVYVDGKRQGTTPPLTSVSVAAGRHRIEVKNTTFPPYSQTHEIKPNEKLKISHKF